ncbi:MAG: DUF5718 family protein [Vibrio sp.]
MNSITMGVIGNYAGHLSGAENVQESELPSGLFVIDQNASSLTTDAILHYPAKGENIDIEPEFVIEYDIIYDGEQVSQVRRRRITIGNDLTIRQLKNETKISARKSWGKASKGVNAQWWALDSMTDLANISLISYIETKGESHLATQPLDTNQIKLFGHALENWLVTTMNHQTDHGMFDQILPQLKANHYPKTLTLFTGAPNYTAWGKAHFLNPDDIMHIIGYQTSEYDHQEVMDLFTSNNIQAVPNILYLKQVMKENELVS